MQIKTNILSHVFNKGQAQECQALKDVSSTIHQGVYIAIIGHTGSGKTTYIEHLNALLLPTSGSINLKYQIGKNQNLINKLNRKIAKTKNAKRMTILKNKLAFLKNDDSFIEVEKNIKKTKWKIKHIKQIRKQIGIVFQYPEYQLFEDTIEKDIMFGPISMGIAKTTAKLLAKKYLKLVGMSENYLQQSPFKLSGGQKRRVALAGILAMEPDVLVFDEPIAGLDPQGTQEILDIFDRLHKNGKTIVIVTHDLDNALARSEYIMMFAESKMVKFGKTYDILKNVEFLTKNNLEPPKILNFVNKLIHNGIKIGNIKTIDDLTNAIIKQKL